METSQDNNAQTLAIMQPYIFPYIGYFQLIHSADKFIFYDDVNFIKQGWINRNRILISGQPHFITVPIKNLSSFTPINQTLIAQDKPWQKKWAKSLQLSYAKTPHFHSVYPMLESVIFKHHASMANLAIESVTTICDYLKITTNIVNSASVYQNNHLHAAPRVIDICKQEKCLRYINASGGAALYDKEQFKQQQIELKFIKSNNISYQQYHYPFTPWLSIIDVLMHNDKEKIQTFLNDYQLI